MYCPVQCYFKKHIYIYFFLNVLFCVQYADFYSEFSLSLKWMFSDGCHQFWLPHHSQKQYGTEEWAVKSKVKLFVLMVIGFICCVDCFRFYFIFGGFCTYFIGKWSVARKEGVPGLWHGHFSWKSLFQEYCGPVK